MALKEEEEEEDDDDDEGELFSRLRCCLPPRSRGPYQAPGGVPLSFNHWCSPLQLSSSSPTSPLQSRALAVEEVANLISSVLSGGPLPSFLEGSVLDAGNNNEKGGNGKNSVARSAVVLIASGVSLESLPPFLASCSSVPVCFAENATGEWRVSDLAPASSLLLWPRVPSLLSQEVSLVKLFSCYRPVFVAYHTEWAGELQFFSSNVDQDDIPMPLLRALELSSSMISASGKFLNKNIGTSGHFVLLNDMSLCLYFDDNCCCVCLRRMFVENDDKTHVLTDSLYFRSTKSSAKSEDVLTLSLSEVKASKFSSLVPLNDSQEDSSSTELNISQNLEQDLAMITNMYELCMKTNPQAFQDVICDAKSMQLLGYSTEKEGKFSSTDCWTEEPSESQNGEVEEGEVEEDDVHSIFNVEFKSGCQDILKNGNKLPICAIDCEMCCTSAGLELTRVSVICPSRGIVLDTLVKPDRRITNYNFEYSGITEEMMTNVMVSRRDVLNALRRIIDADTIIVGHSMSSDFDALGLSHAKVVDTAALYPHKLGLPYKRSLKDLALTFLKKEVQAGDCGHDPVSDALISFALALNYVLTAEDCRIKFMPAPWSGCGGGYSDRYTLFHHMHNILKESGGLCHFSHHYCKSSPNINEHCGLFTEALECNVPEAYSRYIRSGLLPGDDTLNATITRHDNSHSAVDALKVELERGQASRASVHWVCMSVDECGCLDDIGDLDSFFRGLYESAAPDTMFLVLCQEQVALAKTLLANKQRSRWFAASKKAGFASATVTSEKSWCEKDEISLANAITRACAGALLMKYKP